MNKNRRGKQEIVIDENAHEEAPTIVQRLKNAIISVVMGVVFAQVMLFALGHGSLVLWWDNILFISYLIICAIMGGVIGEKFAFTLSKESSLWWDLWNYWRR